VTVFGIFVILLVAIYEISLFRSDEIIESVGEDYAREESFQISFDITFKKFAY